MFRKRIPILNVLLFCLMFVNLSYSHDPTFYPAFTVLSKMVGKWQCDSTNNFFNIVEGKKYVSIRTIDSLTNGSNYAFIDTNITNGFNTSRKDTSRNINIYYLDFDYKIHTLIFTDIGFIFSMISDSMNYSENSIFFSSDSNSATKKLYKVHYSLKLISNDIFDESFIFEQSNTDFVSETKKISFTNIWKRKKS